jgi:Ni,Fe-hydrogenase III large subunit
MTDFLSRLAAAPAVACHPWRRHVLARADWAAMAAALAARDAPELLAMWADTVQVHALFHAAADGVFALASVPVEGGRYPALSPHRPAANWFERMIRDLWGHEAEGGRDLRPWLDHGRWANHAPMGLRPVPVAGPPEPAAFLPVDGEDHHQIPVGPVHAGIIEPGHFRISAQGETIVRLEVRLGYLHKGTLALMRGKSPRAAARFAARLSGDSTVAHGIAFARAAEAASGTEAPARAAALRAMMGELERLANHLGDCGAIINDAGFAFLPARFGWHREAILGAAAAAFGHRLMMDCVVPGGVAADIAAAGPAEILAALAALEDEMPELLRVYGDYTSLVDRVMGTGVVTHALARRFAAGGFIGRSAGRHFDLRRSPGYPPYDRLEFAVPVRMDGDVDARLRLRLDEIVQSTQLLRSVLAALPGGATAVPLPLASGEGIGWAEGFRGDVWHWLRLEGGQIASVFLRDPSWLQWPVLEEAMRGNIVADFPLCNRSFGCSYSGVDL